jgi:hypothetical protein
MMNVLLVVVGLALFLLILRARRRQRDARIQAEMHRPTCYSFEKYTSEPPNSDFRGEHPEETYRSFFREHFSSQVFSPTTTSWNSREFPDATTTDAAGNGKTTTYAPLTQVPSTATIMRVDDLADNTINTGQIVKEADGTYLGFVFSLGLGALPKQYHSRTYSTTASNLAEGNYDGANPYTNISEAMVFNGFDVSSEFSANPASNRHVNGMVGSCDRENSTANTRGETTMAGYGTDATAALHFTYVSKGLSDVKSTYDKNPQGSGLIPGGCKMVDTDLPDSQPNPYKNPSVYNAELIYPNTSKTLGPLSSGQTGSASDQVRTLSALDGTPILNNNAVSGSCPVMNIDHDAISFPDFSNLASKELLELPLATQSAGWFMNWVAAGSYAGENYGYRHYNGPSRIFEALGAEVASVEGHRKLIGMGGFVMNTSMVGHVNAATSSTEGPVDMNSGNACSIRSIDFDSNMSEAGHTRSFTYQTLAYGNDHALDPAYNTTAYSIPFIRSALLGSTGIVAPITYNGVPHVGGMYAIDRLCSIFPELQYTLSRTVGGVAVTKYMIMQFLLAKWKFMEMYMNGSLTYSLAFGTYVGGIYSDNFENYWLKYQGQSLSNYNPYGMGVLLNWMMAQYPALQVDSYRTPPTTQAEIDKMNFYFDSAIGVGPSLARLMHECFYAAGDLTKLTMLAQGYTSCADPRSTWFYATYPEHRKKSRVYFDGYNAPTTKRWASGAFKVSDPMQIADRTGLKAVRRLNGSTAVPAASGDDITVFSDVGESTAIAGGFSDCTDAFMAKLRSYLAGGPSWTQTVYPAGYQAGSSNRTNKQIVYTKDYMGVGDYHNLIVLGGGQVNLADYFPARSIVVPRALDRGQLYKQPVSFPRVYSVLKFLGTDGPILTFFWAHIPLYPGCGYPTMKYEITDTEGKPDYMNNSYHDSIFMFYLVGAETGWKDDLARKGVRPICEEDFYIESVYHGRAQLVRAIDASTRTLDVGNYSRFNEDGLSATFGPRTRTLNDVQGPMMGNFRFYGDQNGMFIYKEKVYGSGDFTVYSDYISAPGMAACSRFKCWTPFRESSGAQSVFRSVVVEPAREGTTASSTVSGNTASVSASSDYLNIVQQRENLTSFRIFKHPCHPQRVIAPVIKNLGVFKAEGWRIVNFGANLDSAEDRWIDPGKVVLWDYNVYKGDSALVPFDKIRRYDAGGASYPITGSWPDTPPGCAQTTNGDCPLYSVERPTVGDMYHSTVLVQTSKWGLPSQNGHITRGDWVQLDIGSARAISSYRIESVPGMSAKSVRYGPMMEGDPSTFGMPKDRTMSDWTLLGSADGDSWWLVDVRANQTFEYSLTGNVYSAAYPGSYRYYRLVGNAVSADNFELIWDFGFYVTCGGAEYPTKSSVPYQTRTTNIVTSPDNPNSYDSAKNEAHAYPYVYTQPSGASISTSIKPYGFDNNYNYDDRLHRTNIPLIVASTTNVPFVNNRSTKDAAGRNLYSFPNGIGLTGSTANVIRAGGKAFLGNPSTFLHGADSPWSFRQPIMSQFTTTPALNYANAQRAQRADGSGCGTNRGWGMVYGPGSYTADPYCHVYSGVGNSFYMQNYSQMDYQYSTNQLYGYLIQPPSGSVASTTISLNNHAFFWPEQHAWMMTFAYTDAYNQISNGGFFSVEDKLAGLLKIMNFNYNKTVKGKSWEKPYAMTPDRRKYSYYRGTTTTVFRVPPNASFVPSGQTIRQPDQDQVDDRFIWPMPSRGGSYLVSDSDVCPSDGSCNLITSGVNGGGSKETCTPQYAFWIGDAATYSRLTSAGIPVQREFNMAITFIGDTNVYNDLPKQCLGRLYTDSSGSNLDDSASMAELYPPPALYKVKGWTLFTYGTSTFVDPRNTSKRLRNAIISTNGKVVFLLPDVATALQYEQYDQTPTGQQNTTRSARKLVSGCQGPGGTNVTIACSSGRIQATSVQMDGGRPTNDSTYVRWGRWDPNCCRDSVSDTNDTPAVLPLPDRCVGQTSCTLVEEEFTGFGYLYQGPAGKKQYEVAWNCDFSAIPQNVSPPSSGQTVDGTQFYPIPGGMTGVQLHGDYYQRIRTIHRQQAAEVFDLEKMPETKRWIDAQLKREWMESDAYREYVKRKKAEKAKSSGNSETKSREHFDILGDIDVCKFAGELLEPLANGILDATWNPLVKGMNNLKFFRDFGLQPASVTLSWSCPIPGLGELFAAIAAVAQAIGKFFSQCFEALCVLFEMAVTGLINLGKKLYEFLSSVFTLENLSNFANMVADGITAGFNYIDSLLGGALTAVASAVSQVAMAIYNFGVAAVDFLVDIGSAAWNAISTAGAAAFDAVCSFGTAIVNLISDGLTAIANFMVNIGNAIADIIASIVNSIKSAICSALNSVFGFHVC